MEVFQCGIVLCDGIELCLQFGLSFFLPVSFFASSSVRYTFLRKVFFWDSVRLRYSVNIGSRFR